MLTPIILLTLGLTAFMALAYYVQRACQNAGWVDVFWTFGTGLGGAALALWPASPPAAPWRRDMVAVMMVFWTFRLGTHIARRVAQSDREDPRYARFRADWGPDFDRRFFRFVIIQGPIAGLLAGCAGLAAHGPALRCLPTDALGGGVFLGGIAIEAIADRQLTRYRKARLGSVCDIGLWSISRHPNYIGQWLLWWGVAIIAIGAGGWHWLALLAPAMMGWLLRFVSGVPPLEQAMLASRGDAYRAYQARVPVFLPWLPVRPPRS